MMQNIFYGSLFVAICFYSLMPERVSKRQHERYNAFMIGWSSVK